jgi:hypothetical protein
MDSLPMQNGVQLIIPKHLIIGTSLWEIREIAVRMCGLGKRGGADGPERFCFMVIHFQKIHTQHHIFQVFTL